MFTLCAFLLLALLSPTSGLAQSRPSPLEGVWRRVEQVRADQTKFPAQPGLRIFSGRYYSWVMVAGTDPRPPLPDTATATAAELRAVWGTPFVAESGTFDWVGNTMTQHPLVAKIPVQMEPTWYITFAYRIVGDSLWLFQSENPNGPLLDQPTGKYVRAR